MPLQRTKGFARHLEQTGVDHAWGIPGNKGTLVCQENQSEQVHFFLVIYWQDPAVAKVFAGENYHVTTTYPDDSAFELLPDPYVLQHEVEAVLPLQADNRAGERSVNSRRLLAA